MCGIVGLWFPQRERHPDPVVLAGMVGTLAHRGPDDRGTWVGPGGGLGAARLSIIDLRGGHQPVLNEDRTVGAVLNGEIYNHEALRRELTAQGHRFRSRVDTEVLVHGYEAWGPEGLARRLAGMFAAAVLDRRRHRLLLLRDRLGIKPLYYYAGPETFVFGSEPKAVLASPEVPRRLDPEGVDLFLTFEFIPPPWTLLRDVRKLAPAHYLVVDEAGVRARSYWRLPPPAAEAPPPREAAARLQELLRESVRDRLMAEVPLGALLSGGVDSSSVVWHMAALGVRPLRTFSIGFREPSYDETQAARAVAEQVGAEHDEAFLLPRAVALVETLLPFLDDPIGDFSVFPTYLVCRLARQRVKVALSGDGGDEVFGGYDTYLAEKVAARLGSLPAPLGRWLFQLGRRLPPRAKKKGAWNTVRRFLEGLGHPAGFGHMRWMLFLAAAEKLAAYGPALRPCLDGFDPEEVVAQVLAREGAADPVERSLRLDLRLYLPENILLKVDRMSMAVSLEARVPLLDHRLVEYVASLPARYKLHGFRRKWLFKRSLAGKLPPWILRRPKSGFSIPMKTWLRGELRELVLALPDGPVVRDYGLLERPYVARLVAEHLAGRADHAHRLWPLVVLSAWCRSILGKGRITTGATHARS